MRLRFVQSIDCIAHKITFYGKEVWDFCIISTIFHIGDRKSLCVYVSVRLAKFGNDGRVTVEKNSGYPDALS